MELKKKKKIFLIYIIFGSILLFIGLIISCYNDIYNISVNFRPEKSFGILLFLLTFWGTLLITKADYIYQEIKNVNSLQEVVPKGFNLHANRAEKEEANRINHIKWYLNDLKNQVKTSLLLIQDENYSHKAENFISFMETLLSNPEFCIIDSNLERIEKECIEILAAAWDASKRAGLTRFPLYDPSFYEFLYLCKKKSPK